MFHRAFRAALVLHDGDLVIALSFFPGMSVPKVEERCRGPVGKCILQACEEQGIATIQHPTLAAELYCCCDVGDSVPRRTYGEVAKVLADSINPELRAAHLSYMRTSRIDRRKSLQTPISINCLKVNKKYDACGNLIERSYADENGKIISGPFGYAVTRIKYNEYGQWMEQSFYDTAGDSCLNPNNYACMTASRDKLGNIVKLSYFGVDGKPILYKDGFSESVLQFDSNDIVTRIATYGKDGRLRNNSDGYALFISGHNEYGNCTMHKYLDSNEKPCMIRGNFHKCVIEYDYAADSETAFLYDTEDSPCMHWDGFFGWKAKYDKFGNIIHILFLGQDGSPCRVRDNTAGWRAHYNSNHQTIKTEFIDLYGKPLLHKWGCFAYENQYNDDGNMIETSYFDLNHNPCQVVTGVATIKYEYDGNDDVLLSVAYDVHGNVLATNILVGHIYSGSRAYAAGMRKNDRIFQYNGEWFASSHSLRRYLKTINCFKEGELRIKRGHSFVSLKLTPCDFDCYFTDSVAETLP